MAGLPSASWACLLHPRAPLHQLPLAKMPWTLGLFPHPPVHCTFGVPATDDVLGPNFRGDLVPWASLVLQYATFPVRVPPLLPDC